MLNLALLLLPALPQASHAPVQHSVLVTNAWGGVPVQGAEVRWVPTAEASPHAREPDPFEVLLHEPNFASGVPLAITDVSGRAMYTRPDANGFVCVRAAELRGAKSTSKGHTLETSVRVFRDFAIEVELEDPAGGTLDDLHVSMRYGGPDRGSTFPAAATRVLVRDGRARIEHAGFLEGRIGYDRRYYVGVDGWLGTPPMTSVPTAAPPAGPVRITLTPHASLALRVVDEEGRSSAPFGQAWIGRPADVPDKEWEAPTTPEMAFRGFVLPAQEAPAQMRRVEPGLRLKAYARRNRESDRTIIEFDGPQVEGEQLEVSLVLGTGLVTFSGRACWPDGSPFEELQLEYALNQTGRGYRSMRELPDGRFVLDVDPGKLEHAGRTLSFLWRSGDVIGRALPDKSSHRILQYPIPLTLSVPLDELWTPGLHDLGELKLAPIAFFASGTLLDAHTKGPIAGATVHAFAALEEVVQSRPTTDEDGCFELHAHTKAEALSLDFVHPHTHDRSKARRVRLEPVARGSRGLVVELPRP